MDKKKPDWDKESPYGREHGPKTANTIFLFLGGVALAAFIVYVAAVILSSSDKQSGVVYRNEGPAGDVPPAVHFKEDEPEVFEPDNEGIA